MDVSLEKLHKDSALLDPEVRHGKNSQLLWCLPDAGRSCWGVLLKYEQICPGIDKMPWN